MRGSRTISYLAVFILAVSLYGCVSDRSSAHRIEGGNLDDVNGSSEVQEMHQLIASPRGPGGGRVGQGGMASHPVRNGRREFYSYSTSFKDIPAVARTVTGPNDLHKFEMLLILARDVDYSVHRAAIEVIGAKYGLVIDWGLTVEERVEGYKQAMAWWREVEAKLAWSESKQMFVIK